MSMLGELLIEEDLAAPSAPDLPEIITVGEQVAPAAPPDTASTGIDPAVLGDLALKLAYTVPSFTTEWAARQLRLPVPLVADLLDQLKTDKLVEILGQTGPLSYRCTITNRGREQATRLLEVSGYIGPAPVSLASYAAMLEWQLARAPALSPQDVSDALSELVLPDEAIQVAGMAIFSGRSLFVFGPAGNGKSSVGRMLHNALRGEIWIPYCISVEPNIIRVFDPGCHHPVELACEEPWTIDHRWVRIRRPLIVVGGELTIEALDLAYSPALRYYEAPLHVKSNGGTLLIDDFGRQRVDPYELLNRWIIPLEHQIDHLTLRTGQKVEVPFRQMLVVATNLDPSEVTDPAFLRRMGYRLHLGKPSPERYAQIFERYAQRSGLTVPPGLIDLLFERYRDEGRDLCCCEPRDLIERVRDICQLHARSLELNEQLLDAAWRGYFGASKSTT
ncbi:MAG: ATP-binding protein [Planctomycetes bacterium]|nr:ATP-binding protein [Planctomycetota bacterium]